MRHVAELHEAHKRSIRHRAEIIESVDCGCFHCLTTFKPAAITEWTDFVNDEGTTALCPKCGTDSVLGSAPGFPITVEFLREMQAHWFDDTE